MSENKTYTIELTEKEINELAGAVFNWGEKASEAQRAAMMSLLEQYFEARNNQ